MSDKRQKNQLQMVLAFAVEGRSEAPKARREGTESLTANCETESPARAEQLMEEVCGRENCLRALRRVKANKGSPGIDGMKVEPTAQVTLKEDAKQRAVITMNSNQPRDIKSCVSRPYRLRGKTGNGWGNNGHANHSFTPGCWRWHVAKVG